MENKVKIGCFVILTESAINDTGSESIRGVPVEVTEIVTGTQFPIRIFNGAFEDYTRSLKYDEIIKVVTKKENPEYFL